MASLRDSWFLHVSFRDWLGSCTFLSRLGWLWCVFFSLDSLAQVRLRNFTEYFCGAGRKAVLPGLSIADRDGTFMSHAHAANFVHCVFSTKERRNQISHELQEKLYAYLIGIADNLGFKILAAGGTANHVHLLIRLPPALALAEVVQKLKANSSRWMGENSEEFEWQKGYGAFSVSPSLLPTVRSYIRNQDEHHKKRTFEEEFLALLQKSGVSYDAERLFAA